MAQTSSLMSLAARRYAGSLFALSAEAGYVEAVEKKLAAISRLLDESDDFRRFVTSPVFSGKDQFRAIDALASQAGLGGDGAAGLVGNFLRIAACNGRLFILSDIIEAFHNLAASARGEISAKVISAHALEAARIQELKAALSDAVGKDVILQVRVDPSILGGLVIRVGSRQLDTSLRTRLSSLKLALKKEVG